MSESTQYAPFKARHVMGSFFEPQTKDHEGKPLPQEKYHWFMGFAVPKGPEWDAIWATMFQAAANDVSCGAALCQQPGFNWKVEDADNPSNPANKGKASYPAGHMIIKFNRQCSIGPVALVDGRGLPIEKEQVKRGDYFYVAASTRFNGAKTVNTNAGMYQNIDGLMFAGQGDEIASEGGFNAATAFAGVQGAMAPGASAPATGSMPGANPQQQAAPVATQAAPSTPASPQQAAPVKVYVHTDTQFTKEQYQAHDTAWTEEALVNAGKGRFEEQQAAPVATPAAPRTPASPGAPTSGVQPAHDFLQQPGVTNA